MTWTFEKMNIRNSEKLKLPILDRSELWWPSLTNYHLVGHFGRQPLPKITKMTVVTRVNIETYDTNQTALNLAQSSTSTCCQPSWTAIITRNHKSGCHHSQSQHRDLQQNHWVWVNLQLQYVFRDLGWQWILNKIQMAAMALLFVMFGYGWHPRWLTPW